MKTFKHNLGNMIAGVIQIADGIILIASLGFIKTSWSFKWVIYRLKTGTLNNSINNR